MVKLTNIENPSIPRHLGSIRPMVPVLNFGLHGSNTRVSIILGAEYWHSISIVASGYLILQRRLRLNDEDHGYHE